MPEIIKQIAPVEPEYLIKLTLSEIRALTVNTGERSNFTNKETVNQGQYEYIGISADTKLADSDALYQFFTNLCQSNPS